MFEVGQPVPREVDQVRGDLVLAGAADLQPPLPGARDHPDQ